MTRPTNQPQPRTLAEVERLIGNAKALKTGVDTRLPELEKHRRQALLEADDAAVDKLEREIEIAKRDRERAIARLSILDDERVDAIEREAQGEAQALAERAERVRTAGVKLITIDYQKAAQALAEILKKLAAAEEFIRDVNRRIGDRIAHVEAIGSSAGRLDPETSHYEVEKWWRFPSFPEYAGIRLRSVDGSACPPRPDKRPLGQDKDGEWLFEAPELRQRHVKVVDSNTRHGDDIEVLVGVLPAVGLDDDPIWDRQCLEDARANFERLADELLDTAGEPASKRGRPAAAAA